jgi:hypothetical protein
MRVTKLISTGKELIFARCHQLSKIVEFFLQGHHVTLKMRSNEMYEYHRNVVARKVTILSENMMQANTSVSTSENNILHCLN